MNDELKERLNGLKELSNVSTYNLEMANVILYELFGHNAKLERVVMRTGVRYFFKNIQGADTNPFGFKTMKKAFKYLRFQELHRQHN